VARERVKKYTRNNAEKVKDVTEKARRKRKKLFIPRDD